MEVVTPAAAAAAFVSALPVVAIDVARAAVDCNVHLNVNTDGPLTVILL